MARMHALSGKGVAMALDRKTARVFVVDDETVIAITLGLILQKKGFEVHTFNFPLEALRAASEIPPNLLITDVMMPLLSGIEQAIQIREFCPNCKVLLFSGHAATLDLVADAGASGHHFDMLTKPVHPKDLLKKIETVFAN